MIGSKYLLLASCLVGGCTDWRDTQNPELFVLSYYGLSPFPESAQVRALQNDDPDLGGEGCKRVLTPHEANAFNALLSKGEPIAHMTTRYGFIPAEEITLAEAYTVVIHGPDNRFAGLMNGTTTRNFEGQLFEIAMSDYFRIEFAAFEVLAAKGCGEVFETEVERGLQIPRWATDE